MKKQTPYVNPMSSRRQCPFDLNAVMAAYTDGTYWYGIEQADLYGVVTSDILNDPLQTIQAVFSGSLTTHVKAVGYCFTNEIPDDLNYGVTRLHDSGVTWAEIETSQGVYNAAKLAHLDDFVNKSFAAGRDVIYTVYLTPTWAAVGGDQRNIPTNWTYLENWLAFLYARYGTKITHYEGWNEPNVSGSFAGSLADLVEHQKCIYQKAKALNATLKVISPAWTFTAGIAHAKGLSAYASAAYAASGNVGAYCDIWGYHFYAQTNFLRFDRSCVDAVKTAIATLPTAIKALPIWCTEVGCSRPSYRTAMESVAYCLAKGIERVVLYSWDNTGKGDMALKNYCSISQLNEIASLMSGVTITRMNTVKSVEVGSTPCVFGGQIGAVINGIGRVLT